MATSRKKALKKARAGKRKKKPTRAELERQVRELKKKLAEKKKPKRAPKKKAAAESGVKKYASRIGKTTHISARESEGEPQYTWKELEERAAPLLERRKGRKKRWARFIAEMSPGSLLRPDEYKRLRGKPVIRTLWLSPEELVGRIGPIVEQLQRTEAVTPRMKIVIVESKKRPPKRMF